MTSRPDLLPETLEAALGWVTEEAGEVVVAAGKLLRFGPRAVDPVTQIAYDNVQDLANEAHDLQRALSRYLDLLSLEKRKR